jgi:hypothetical protein
MNAIFSGSVEREIPLVSLYDVQNNSRNFPLLAQAQVLKQMAGRGGAAEGDAARSPADQADQMDATLSQKAR